MKVSDYIADFVADISGGSVFLVTGGAITHIVDSLGKKMDAKRIEYICVQHEQAGAMAAEAYSRLGAGLGVMIATSGPGATNLLTGICGCWFDSIPALFLCGQVATRESLEAVHSKPRQVGFQETDIISMARSVTKFSVKVTDPLDVPSLLQYACAIARSDRPGPVLIDIPLDIQIADIDDAGRTRLSYGGQPTPDGDRDSREQIRLKIRDMYALMQVARRPVIVLGAGIRSARAEREALDFSERLGFPIVVSWGGFDLIPHDHLQFAGHFGVYGNRGANFTIQNSDLIICLGSRLDTRQTGGRVDLFARAAKKIMVDIDKNEIMKGRGLSIDIGICCDLKEFFSVSHQMYPSVSAVPVSQWLAKARQWKSEYSIKVGSTTGRPFLDPYAFLSLLSDVVDPDAVIIVDEGGNLVWTMQTWHIKRGQRLFSTFGNSPMGYSLPAAIGASLALGKKMVICIDGDGGFQLNIQELQTVQHYKLPIKMFILNNHGYGIIKQFQDQYFGSRYEATGRGYSAPDFAYVARAYNIEAMNIMHWNEAKEQIRYVLNYPGPILCNVEIDPDARLNPKLEFGRPLEDMSPLLADTDFSTHMIIDQLPRDKSTGWK